jgi:hypothetical protein
MTLNEKNTHLSTLILISMLLIKGKGKAVPVADREGA